MKSKVFFFQCVSDKDVNVGEQADKALAKWLADIEIEIIHCAQTLTSPDCADKLVITLFYKDA